MDDLFGSTFEIESIESVEVIDTDPNIYVKRAEDELKNRRYRNAINEIDDAIKYCEDKEHYMLEKVKILNACSYAQSNMRIECINYIKNNLNIFYSELNINEFIKIIGYYNDCFKQSKSNIAEVLKSKGIPYILGEGYSGEEYINRQLILNKAEVALLEKRLDDALSHISIIEDKYSVDIDCLMVKGKIFKSLKDYDNAIACFSTIINKDILEFGAILQLNITKCIKYKKVIVGAILAIIILILTQFMLFKYGILPSHVNYYDINVSNGRYIKDYVNSIVIPLDETIDIDLQYKMTPFYGKLGDISYTVEDETIISVDGNNKVTGLKIGETNLNVLINGKIEHTVAFSIVEPTVDSIELSYGSKLLKQDSISAGESDTVGLKSDGTVVAVGYYSYGVEDWKDIVAISAGEEHIVGLKSDGTVVAVGKNYGGQCEVEGWKDIVAISAGEEHTVGLKSDGTVVAVGYNSSGECEVEDWKDIVAISAGWDHTVGLKSDGTVISTDLSESELEEFKNIVDISGWYGLVGLKSNGTVAGAGEHSGKREIKKWDGIAAISTSPYYTVGLKLDGTVVVAVREGYSGKVKTWIDEVEDWKDIVAISAGGEHIVGLKSDGTVVATGENYAEQCEVKDWINIKVN